VLTFDPVCSTECSIPDNMIAYCSTIMFVATKLHLITKIVLAFNYFITYLQVRLSTLSTLSTGLPLGLNPNSPMF